MARDVLLAAILGAHGLKGEVRVKTFTERPQTCAAYGPLHARDGRVFTVASLRGGKDGEAVARFEEVASREAAEALKGTELFVARAALPATSQEEFYHADLVGLDAQDRDGRRIGTVTGVRNFGASDVLAIAPDSGDEILIAFTRENVPQIDMKSGRITVVVPDEIEAEGDLE